MFQKQQIQTIWFLFRRAKEAMHIENSTNQQTVIASRIIKESNESAAFICGSEVMLLVHTGCSMISSEWFIIQYKPTTTVLWNVRFSVSHLFFFRDKVLWRTYFNYNLGKVSNPVASVDEYRHYVTGVISIDELHNIHIYKS